MKIAVGFGSIPPLRTMQLILGQNVGPDNCPYLKRWAFITKYGSLRIHKWIYSDDLRHPHDHAWNFLTIVLKGCLWDKSEGKLTRRGLGSINFYKAEHRHSVVVKDPAWTMLITGPERNRWGYWVDGKFRKRNKYYYEHGHHDPLNPTQRILDNYSGV